MSTSLRTEETVEGLKPRSAVRLISLRFDPYYNTNQMQTGPVTLARLWQAYTHVLARYPKLTKLTTGTLITVLGDLICQYMLEGATRPNAKRVQAVSTYGALVTYAEGHLWLGFLERAVGTSMSLRSSFVKTLLDQGLFAPLETSGFIAWTHYVEGHQTSLKEKLNADLPAALCCSYFFWGPICMLEFLFVPYPLRVLYISTMSVAWDTYLSYVAHNSLQSPAALTLNLAL